MPWLPGKGLVSVELKESGCGALAQQDSGFVCSACSFALNSFCRFISDVLTLGDATQLLQ